MCIYPFVPSGAVVRRSDDVSIRRLKDDPSVKGVVHQSPPWAAPDSDPHNFVIRIIKLLR